MTDRELMQMALDALEGYARNCRCEGGGAPCDAAKALRARLAQPEQEPVAWMHTTATGDIYFRKKPHDKVFNPQPVYTAPPKREWQGLTHEEQGQVAWACGAMSADWLEFARAIEAKLKEKNT